MTRQRNIMFGAALIMAFSTLQAHTAETIASLIQEIIESESPDMFAQLTVLRRSIGQLCIHEDSEAPIAVIRLLFNTLRNRYLDILRETEEFERYAPIQQALKVLFELPLFHYVLLVGLIEAIVATLSPRDMYPLMERKKAARRLRALFQEVEMQLSGPDIHLMHAAAHMLSNKLQKTILETFAPDSTVQERWYHHIEWNIHVATLLRLLVSGGTIIALVWLVNKTLQTYPLDMVNHHERTQIRTTQYEFLRTLIALIPTVIIAITTPTQAFTMPRTSDPMTPSPAPRPLLPRQRRVRSIAGSNTMPRTYRVHLSNGCIIRIVIPT